ncbi:MAG: 4-demethylwyosine synthase TYW1 [Nanoarchaeota archaeon]|nr:4-demethylwyosine synthase TYW1 [Nanoarchaeota archaeon]
MVSDKIKAVLEKQGYRFVGNHSACKICEWTRKSLTDKDVCYKQKFYGVKSHQCCQMTPSVFCVNRCVFCWRDTSLTTKKDLGKKVDEPKDIIGGCIAAQRKLLSGFGGNDKVNAKKLREAQDPKYFAISLTGEPTLYPKLDGLLSELKKQKKCSFLVTNGLFPKSLENLSDLPVQLYVSVDAPNKRLYDEVDRPLAKDSWDRFNKTLGLLPSLKTRKVLRLTLVKGLNMVDAKGYAQLIKKADPDFVEIKAYMWVGHSRLNLELKNMPLHKDVKAFSQKIIKLTGLEMIDEKENSRVVLLSGKDSKKRMLSF